MAFYLGTVGTLCLSFRLTNGRIPILGVSYCVHFPEIEIGQVFG